MENYKFNLNEQNIEQELRCIICLCMPEDPLQCVGCDSIMCRDCSDSMGSTRICPLKCKDPHYTKVKPKTMMLFDCLEIHCDDCGKTFKSLEYAKHQKFCGKKSYTKKDLEYQYRPTNAHLYAPPRDQRPVESNPIPPRDQQPRGRSSSQEFPRSQANYFNAYSNSRASDNSREDPLLDHPLTFPLVEQSNYNNNIQVNIQNNLPVVKKSAGWWISLILTGLIAVAATFSLGNLGLHRVLDNGSSEFKVVCFNNLFDDDPGICLFGVGQFSLGIFAFGQLAVGLFTLGQIGIGVFFGVGQVMGGAGLSIGQVTTGLYVLMAQFGIAIWRVKRAMLGLSCLYPLIKKSDIATSNCCESNNNDN